MAKEKRLIDANALTDDTYILNSWDAPIVRAWLDDQPTVDAVEVVHGWWVDEYPDVRCSACGAVWTNCLTDNDPKRFYYCPNCGANMMDGGNEDV